MFWINQSKNFKLKQNTIIHQSGTVETLIIQSMKKQTMDASSSLLMGK